MNKYRFIEALSRIFLWIAVVIIYTAYIAELFEPLPRGLETMIISLNVSLTVILLWFMPSSRAERILRKGLRYMDRDNDKAVQYLKEYLDSKMLMDSERKNALRILGVAHHKRGDDEAAIENLQQALEGNDKDNDLKAEVLGAMGVIYSESGEYQKAVEYFDRTFEILFSVSRANVDNTTLILVMNTYIKADQKEKAVQIYDRLSMIRGFKRSRMVEKMLDI
ncbi:MAG TPA: tetratricopeptide repeat protein [Bacillota bacterium]|nr:tetratricopeptide repeat protein [Bacillota bacterium]